MKKTLLTPRVLYAAYSQGYFPMPDEETNEILWFRPDPRAIIPLEGLHVSRSLKRVINKNLFRITFNESFEGVISGCAQREKTWINKEIHYAHCTLNRIGAAQSVEVWQEDQLVGGVYGVSFGGAFFAESMFHRATNASKIAIYFLVKKLVERNFKLLEVQFLTDHLKTLGAIEIPDSEYMQLLTSALEMDVYF